MRLDAALHHDQRVLLRGFVARLLQPLGVAPAVLELEGVDRQHFRADLVAALAVEQVVEPLARRDAVVVGALGADVEVLLEVGAVEHRLARLALAPQPFRDDLLGAPASRLILGGSSSAASSCLGSLRATAVQRLADRRAETASTRARDLVARRLLDLLDERAADHDRVGDMPAIARARSAASRMPKPTPTGSRVNSRMRATPRRDVGEIDVRGAGHALQRHVVEVAAAERRDLLQARVRRRRRQQEDRVEAARIEQPRPALALPRADSRPPARRRRPPPSRRRRSAPCPSLRSGWRSRTARPASRDRVLRNSATKPSTSLSDTPCFNARSLERWITGPSAIGSENGTPSSITSAPPFDQRVHERHGERRLGIAGGDEGNRAPCGPAACSASKVAAMRDMALQILMPDFSATVCMSLSPRPERLTSRIWSLLMRGAIFAA